MFYKPVLSHFFLSDIVVELLVSYKIDHGMLTNTLHCTSAGLQLVYMSTDQHCLLVSSAPVYFFPALVSILSIQPRAVASVRQEEQMPPPLNVGPEVLN